MKASMITICLATIVLLCTWFCGTYQQNNFINTKIKEIYGINPFEVPTNTSNSVPEGDDWCECPAKLRSFGVQNCVCIPHYYCDDSQVVDSLGKGIINLRGDEDQPCPSLSWCCSLDNLTSTPIKPDDDKTPGCGWRKPEGVGYRLIGNSDKAEFGEFPWMMAIMTYTQKYLDEQDLLISYKCGGTLIHPQAVITAARCVYNKTFKYLVRAGEWDSQNDREIYPSQDRKVKSITIRTDFDRGALLNNVAFLLLESPIDMDNPNVGVACLPRQGERFWGGTECYTSGWGLDKFGLEGKYQSVLKKVNLPIVARNVCEDRLRTTRVGKYFQLHESFICAGGEKGIDMCKGDGGSPLVCPIPGFQNRYQHAGIVSWGIGCGEEGIPGVYASVARFRDWIDLQATRNNLDTSVYTY